MCGCVWGGGGVWLVGHFLSAQSLNVFGAWWIEVNGTLECLLCITSG